jgi:hypothetical protein
LDDAHRTVVEPSKHEIVAPLHGLGISFRGAVGLEVVAAVLEGHSIFALEFFVVPFRDFGVSEKRVVAASEAGFHALGDVVV